jgi:hypothetical protein
MLATIFEITLAAVVIYAVWHEDKFVEFEDKLKERFKK